MSKSLIYAAYGANMNLVQMKRRCRGAEKLGTGVIQGYKLLFKGRAEGRAYATIDRNRGVRFL
ncbi:MAG TPA: gamma-glutamylcyclotransferase [Clostridia bacterium]|nr:gamma-glutamylcyclotransferase [Clostridia bacterium]